MSKTCKVAGCDRTDIHGQKMCAKHYARWKRHGHTKATRADHQGWFKMPEYRVYRNLIARCYYKKNTEYHRYGGRGIKVCDRWLEKPWGFRNFLEDMGKRPDGEYKNGKALYSIDRINVDGDYTPENCRWVTTKEQSRNVTYNKWYTYKGKTQILKDWATEYNIPYTTLRNRWKAGRREDDLLYKGNLCSKR